MPDISKPKLVFVTGPDALLKGYTHAVTTMENKKTKLKHTSHFSTLIDGAIKKLPRDGYGDGFSKSKVPYPRDRPDDPSTEYIKIKDRIHREMDTVHWKKFIQATKSDKPKGSCRKFLVVVVVSTCLALLRWYFMDLLHSPICAPLNSIRPSCRNGFSHNHYR
jgi:hypothetical protein